MRDLTVDPDRLALFGGEVLGIPVRAQLLGVWGSHDIIHLDAPSLLEWLRSRGGNNPWAEQLVAILLHHSRESWMSLPQQEITPDGVTQREVSAKIEEIGFTYGTLKKGDHIVGVRLEFQAPATGRAASFNLDTPQALVMCDEFAKLRQFLLTLSS